MSTTPEEQTSADWLAVVRDKVAAIRFGSVQITVHDGRVTQVEANEKTRIAPDRVEAPLPVSKPKK
ncbi:MAG: YezD family protein [Verrucomicrobiota bacterium]